MNPFASLLDGVMFTWPNAIVAAAIFIALLFRPEQISNRLAFKVGCFLFALSLLTPAIVAFLPTFSTQNLPVARASGPSLLAKFAGLLQPLAFSLSFLCLVSSLLTKIGASK